MAHIHGRPDNEAQWLDDLLGRGKGDPDINGYPGENYPKAPVQNTEDTSGKTNQSLRILTRHNKMKTSMI